MKIIPNLFTLLNLVFGCIAILFILQTGQTLVTIEAEGYTSWELPEKITWGSLFIFAAAIVDFLDGFVARLFKAESAMGKQLDSLADVVSFGVAPGNDHISVAAAILCERGKRLGHIYCHGLLPAFHSSMRNSMAAGKI